MRMLALASVCLFFGPYHSTLLHSLEIPLKPLCFPSVARWLSRPFVFCFAQIIHLLVKRLQTCEDRSVTQNQKCKRRSLSMCVQPDPGFDLETQVAHRCKKKGLLYLTKFFLFQGSLQICRPYEHCKTSKLEIWTNNLFLLVRPLWHNRLFQTIEQQLKRSCVHAWPHICFTKDGSIKQ